MQQVARAWTEYRGQRAQTVQKCFSLCPFCRLCFFCTLFLIKILLALSGGIDSSTVAHMLHEQGHDLVGVRFTLWSDPLAPPMAHILPSKCCNTQTASRAAATAKKLHIPYHVVDLEREFKENVVDPFLEGYRKGLTPNPCIGCNRTIKFGKLLEIADELGCEKIATGHYARVVKERLPDGTDRFLLLEATDQLKDQSYYLYGLTQQQLSRVLFPLGAMHKEEVYSLAKHFGVPFDEHYRESQDLCFFPEKEPKAFLKRHLKDALIHGEIVRRDGTVIGTHEGLPLYTIGQRRGLKVGGLKVPLEVVEKDPQSNRIIVAQQSAESIDEVTLADLRWVSWRPSEGETVPFECRVRSLSERKVGQLTIKGNTGLFRFKKAQKRIAPGQSLVLYRGEEVAGGGITTT
ncbi:tRNA 2-thiouridine(34) synthase MnmA [Candidatus Peregrinibacteria bacterium]|nr:tRNA 2-thiouridine(34) synthase MnmA [Candidatus Peregrinibacteria bacterium]